MNIESNKLNSLQVTRVNTSLECPGTAQKFMGRSNKRFFFSFLKIQKIEILSNMELNQDRNMGLGGHNRAFLTRRSASFKKLGRFKLQDSYFFRNFLHFIIFI